MTDRRDDEGTRPVPAVVVVGSLNLDSWARSPRLPRPGETLTGSRYGTSEGGKGANQAVAAARFGASVAMVGQVGRDAAGRRLVEALRGDGVGCEAVGDSDAQTGFAAILVGEDGENCIVVVPGANHALRPAHVDAQAALLEAARVVVLQLEIPMDTVEAVLSVARGAGVVTLLNAAPASAAASRLVTGLDWLVVNADEASLLAGTITGGIEGAHEAARALCAMGAADVVVTLGVDGLIHANAGGSSRYDAVPVDVVDTTGAGDTFVGVLAANLAAEVPVPDALRQSQAAAALAVTRSGAQPAIPTRADVMARWPHLFPEG